MKTLLLALSIRVFAGCGASPEPTVTYPPPPGNHDPKTNAQWRCTEIHGEKKCGYDCVEAYGQIECTDNPEENCVKSHGDLRCGKNCRVEVGSIECDS